MCSVFFYGCNYPMSESRWIGIKWHLNFERGGGGGPRPSRSCIIGTKLPSNIEGNYDIAQIRTWILKRHDPFVVDHEKVQKRLESLILLIIVYFIVLCY